MSAALSPVKKKTNLVNVDLLRVRRTRIFRIFAGYKFSKISSAMAKGNPFLGDARGSVGDVTLYIKNGKQITRVRRRSVANPNSEGQLIQRAILATIGKAYQAGSEIFDHAFEGVQRGAKSQARFQKENIDLLRGLVVADLDASHGEGTSTAAVVPRGAFYPVPNRYLISRGTLPPIFGVQFNGIVGEVDFPPAETNETVAQYCARLGLIDDDIFTVCVFGIPDDLEEQDSYRTAFECLFGFVRLRVKTAALSSSTLMSAATLGDLFEVDANMGSAAAIAARTFSSGLLMTSVVPTCETGSMGVIRSRENSTLRSTCQMSVQDEANIKWGIIPKYLYEFWDPSALAAGQSDLILEGGGFQ